MISRWGNLIQSNEPWQSMWLQNRVSFNVGCSHYPLPCIYILRMAYEIGCLQVAPFETSPSLALLHHMCGSPGTWNLSSVALSFCSNIDSAQFRYPLTTGSVECFTQSCWGSLVRNPCLTFSLVLIRLNSLLNSRLWTWEYVIVTEINIKCSETSSSLQEYSVGGS